MALNKTHEHLQELQSGFNKLTAVRVRLENELQQTDQHGCGVYLRFP